MTELDDRIVRLVRRRPSRRGPMCRVTIRYLEKHAAPFSVFEAAAARAEPRAGSPRKSRPLRADRPHADERGQSTQDSEPFVDKPRLDAGARAAMQTLRDDLAAFCRARRAAVRSRQPPRRDPRRRGHLRHRPRRAAGARRALRDPAGGLGVRLRLPAAHVRRAPRAVRTSWSSAGTTGSPSSTRAWSMQRAAAAHRRGEVRASSRRPSALDLDDRADAAARHAGRFPSRSWHASSGRRSSRSATSSTRSQNTHAHVGRAALCRCAQALLPVTDFDVVEFTAHRARRRDGALRRGRAQRGAGGASPSSIAGSRLSHDALRRPRRRRGGDREGAARWRPRAKALLGDDFRIFPEFASTAAQGDELENALAASRGGDAVPIPHQPARPGNATPLDFPVDTWLYGVARVRDKMRAWEQMVMFAGALRPARSPALDALQLPFTPGDRWLGLEFPPDHKLGRRPAALHRALRGRRSTRARRSAGCCSTSGPRSIPGRRVDTGIAFHYDRPNCRGAADDAAGHAVGVPRRLAVGRPGRRAERDARPGQAARRRADAHRRTRPTRRSCRRRIMATPGAPADDRRRTWRSTTRSPSRAQS